MMIVFALKNNMISAKTVRFPSSRKQLVDIGLFTLFIGAGYKHI